MTPTRLLSIQPGIVAAIRSAMREGEGATVDYGIKGTTAERPWGVVAPKNGADDG